MVLNSIFGVFHWNQQRKKIPNYLLILSSSTVFFFDRAQLLTQDLLKQDYFAFTLKSSLLKKTTQGRYHELVIDDCYKLFIFRWQYIFFFCPRFFSSSITENTFIGLDHEKNGGWHKKQELPTLREHMSSLPKGVGISQSKYTPIHATLYSIHILIACLPWSRYELL